jgi:ABC-type amino acid transport substrate-binding protein
LLVVLLHALGSFPGGTPNEARANSGESSGEQQKLIVATKHAPPFAFQDESGRWQGLSIGL